jgi:hypothetical protein
LAQQAVEAFTNRLAEAISESLNEKPKPAPTDENNGSGQPEKKASWLSRASGSMLKVLAMPFVSFVKSPFFLRQVIRPFIRSQMELD